MRKFNKWSEKNAADERSTLMDRAAGAILQRELDAKLFGLCTCGYAAHRRDCDLWFAARIRKAPLPYPDEIVTAAQRMLLEEAGKGVCDKCKRDATFHPVTLQRCGHNLCPHCCCPGPYTAGHVCRCDRCDL